MKELVIGLVVGAVAWFAFKATTKQPELRLIDLDGLPSKLPKPNGKESVVAFGLRG